MFSTHIDFEQEAINAIKIVNEGTNFQASFKTHSNSIFSSEGAFLLEALLGEETLLQLYLIHAEGSNFVESFFCFKSRTDEALVSIEGVRDKVSPNLFQKVEGNLSRFDLTSNCSFVPHMMYKLNQCGIEQLWHNLCS